MAVPNMETEQINLRESGVENAEQGVEDYRDLQREVEAEYAQKGAFVLEGDRGSDFQEVLRSFSGRVEMFVREMEEKLKTVTKHKLH
jgi:hypothetical protein